MKQLRPYLNVLVFMLLSICSVAQNNPYWQEPTRKQADSLKIDLATSTNDSVTMYINRQLGMYYQEINRMAALTYYEEMLKLARSVEQKWICILFDSELFGWIKISFNGQRLSITKGFGKGDVESRSAFQKK
jgi:hypothetical protein